MNLKKYLWIIIVSVVIGISGLFGALGDDLISDLVIAGILFVMAIYVKAWWNIFQKAGYSGKRGLLMFIPIVNIVIFFMFGFGEWPVRKQLRKQEQELLSGVKQELQ